MKNNLIKHLFLVLAISFLFAAKLQAQSGFHLIKKTVIGGEGGWDYLNLDPATGTLYITRGLVSLANDGDHTFQ